MVLIAGALAFVRGLRLALAALFLVGLFSACSTAPAHGESPLAAGGPWVPESAAPAASSEQAPEGELTSDLLFRLMYAEIAVQRGESAAAFTELMAAARQT
ncbi:MAG TPA: hypothetical protein VEI29_05600, partial [Burkholderiaceae bacterium]|nr:hypothetical protein [Burkholderiaceae bacterium]